MSSDGKGIYTGRGLWRMHPHVRTDNQLTFGERAADIMRNAFGSWAFVGSFLGFMAIWMLLNTVVLHGGFDHYPYILLNLSLSMMAGLQGALILIAAKRADRVAAEQSIAHYTETSKMDELLTENNDMTAQIKEATALLEDLQSDVHAILRAINVKSAIATAPPAPMTAVLGEEIQRGNTDSNPPSAS
jgi:uncharacterized membrane protein